MKRKSIIIILSAVTMLTVLVGCGGNSVSGGADKKNATTQITINKPADALPDPQKIIGDSVVISSYSSSDTYASYDLDNCTLDDYNKYCDELKKIFTETTYFYKDSSFEAKTSDGKYEVSCYYSESSEFTYIRCGLVSDEKESSTEK